MSFNIISKILDSLNKADEAIQVVHGVVKGADAFVQHLKEIDAKKQVQKTENQETRWEKQQNP